MERDPRAFLWDARNSADAIARFLFEKSFDDYLRDEMLRSEIDALIKEFGEAR